MFPKKNNKPKDSQKFELFFPEFLSPQQLNLFSSQIPAGFPSPAEDFLEKRLDLNEYLVKNKSATFLIKVHGDSMVNAGIFDGDMLVIDRSVEPVSGKIVLGVLNGEFTIKRIEKKKNKSSKRIIKLLSKPKQLLIIILFGNTVVNVAATSLAAFIAISIGDRLFENGHGFFSIFVEIVIMTLLLLIFGEITPKLFAFSSPERIVGFSSFIIGFLKIIFYPIIIFLEFTY